MNGTRYQVKVDNALSDEFDVLTVLIQGDVLSPLLFNIALKKVIRSVQINNRGVKIDEIVLDVLGFADDINILGEDKESVVQNTTSMINEARKIGLTINEKTIVMETENSEDENLAIKDYVFKKIQSFKYLGATITGNNDWYSEICNRINKGERTYFALINT
jgi:hypothetical protein